MKMDPLPSAPTNADLGDRLGQVHTCLEANAEAVAKTAKAAVAAHRGLTQRVAKLDKRVAGLAKAIGVDEDGNKVPHAWWKVWRIKSVFEMTPWQFGGALSGLFFLLKIIDAVWPSVLSAAQALWRLI